MPLWGDSRHPRAALPLSCQAANPHACPHPSSAPSLGARLGKRGEGGTVSGKQAAPRKEFGAGLPSAHLRAWPVLSSSGSFLRLPTVQSKEAGSRCSSKRHQPGNLWGNQGTPLGRGLWGPRLMPAFWKRHNKGGGKPQQLGDRAGLGHMQSIL